VRKLRAALKRKARAKMTKIWMMMLQTSNRSLRNAQKSRKGMIRKLRRERNLKVRTISLRSNRKKMLHKNPKRRKLLSRIISRFLGPRDHLPICHRKNTRKTKQLKMRRVRKNKDLKMKRYVYISLLIPI
jgi:hypothetical protein